MAYRKISSGYRSAEEYVCDTQKDLEKLNAFTHLGTQVLVLESGKVFVKNSKGKWVEL